MESKIHQELQKCVFCGGQVNAVVAARTTMAPPHTPPVTVKYQPARRATQLAAALSLSSRQNNVITAVTLN